MQTIELQVEGMMCGACVGHVSQALQSVPGVGGAVVDLSSATARVTGENLDATALVAAVEEEGYKAREISGAPKAAADSPSRAASSD